MEEQILLKKSEPVNFPVGIKNFAATGEIISTDGGCCHGRGFGFQFAC